MVYQDLQFNYAVLTVLSGLLVSMLIFAVFSKIMHEHGLNMRSAALKRYLSDIAEIIDAGSDVGFENLLNTYYLKNFKLMNRGKQRSIFEEAILQTINENHIFAEKAREIAYKFGFADESIINLEHKNLLHKLRGCQQAGAYLYDEAVPLVLDMLHFINPRIQYNALLALSDFKNPELIAKGFKIIKNAVLVNDRTVREIIEKMGNEQGRLFGMILKTKSPSLIPLFLKFIDKESVIKYLNEIKQFVQSEDMEMRIASVRALSKTQDKKILPYIISTLDDDKWEVRAAAAKGISEIRDEKTYLPILKAMEDSAWWVRQNAAMAALSVENPKILIDNVLRSGDSYAADSLYHAAELMNMTHLIEEVKERQLPDKTIQSKKIKSGTCYA